jgi:cobalt-zinc-cadmium efflux system outer membrane protein
MHFVRMASALCTAFSLLPGVVSAQTLLTLPEALARAREQAPRIISARLAVAEARGRLAGASLRFRQNPELQGAVGNRPSGQPTDFEIGLAQTLEPGGRRAARVEAASAAIGQGAADLDEVTRLVLRETASAFLRALHASERIRLLTATEQLAAAVHQIADRRFRAGDLAVLDVNIARSAVARVRADGLAATAVRAAALTELRQLLPGDEIDVRGDLLLSEVPDTGALLQSASQRPELRALEAAIREADAEVQLGRTFGSPDYGFGIRYEREEGHRTLFGGMTLTLPVFSKGQELRAVGSARAARLRAELDAARRRIQTEVRATLGVYGKRLEAVRLLEREALPGSDENETLAERSFEVGQIGLPDLLLIRREIMDTRFQYLDALLEAVLARVELDASAAILR